MSLRAYDAEVLGRRLRLSVKVPLQAAACVNIAVNDSSRMPHVAVISLMAELALSLELLVSTTSC